MTLSVIWVFALTLSTRPGWSTTPKSESPVSPPGCTADLGKAKPWAYAGPISRLFNEGYMDGEDVVGLVALSRSDFWRLLDKGNLSAESGFDFFPYQDNPHVAFHLDEHASVDWNGLSPRRQERAAADRAWELTIGEVFNARLAKAGVDRTLTPGYTDVAAEILRPSPAPELLFDAPMADIKQLPEDSNVVVDTPMKLEGARLSRDLSRRLNLGDDLNDLTQWSALRAIAQTFAIRWTAERSGPALEEALQKYFSGLPREGGVVVSLRSKAFRKVVWSENEWPYVSYLHVDDIAGLRALGSEELALLKRLPRP